MDPEGRKRSLAKLDRVHGGTFRRVTARIGSRRGISGDWQETVGT